MTKRYVTLRCSICDRQKDQLINLTHYTPDRCTITLGCEGRLSPVGYTSDSTSLLGVPPTGLSNWYARGSSTSSNTPIVSDALYNTSTGTKQQIVLAVSGVDLGFTPSANSTVTVKFIAEQQSTKDFRQYTYRRSSPFTVVNGVEDNQAKKVLRYSTADQVDVYVNGVKRAVGVDYLLYDGSTTSPVPPNSVLFTSTQTGSSTQVDVVVSAAAAVSTAELVFTRATDDESRAGTGAWEGITAVKSPAIQQWSLFYCDFSEVGASLGLDVKLNVSEITLLDTVQYSVSRASLLLSRSKLFTQVDRQRSMWVPIQNLTSNSEYLIVKLIEGVRSMMVTESSTKNLFPVLDVLRFDPAALQTTNLSGNSAAAELDNTLIIGPDA